MRRYKKIWKNKQYGRRLQIKGLNKKPKENADVLDQVH